MVNFKYISFALPTALVGLLSTSVITGSDQNSNNNYESTYNQASSYVKEMRADQPTPYHVAHDEVMAAISSYPGPFNKQAASDAVNDAYGMRRMDHSKK